MPEQTPNGLVYTNEIGMLPPLTNEEHLALVTGFAQVANGDDPTPHVAATCIRTLARLSGVSLDGHVAGPGELVGTEPRPITVVNLDEFDPARGRHATDDEPSTRELARAGNAGHNLLASDCAVVADRLTTTASEHCTVCNEPAERHALLINREGTEAVPRSVFDEAEARLRPEPVAKVEVGMDAAGIHFTGHLTPEQIDGPLHTGLMTDAQLTTWMGTDATRWAAEFAKRFRVAFTNAWNDAHSPLREVIEELIDPAGGGMLHGWFANAIEHARGVGYASAAKAPEAFGPDHEVDC